MTENDSESDDKEEKLIKKLTGYYYVQKLTMCLHEKHVSRPNIPNIMLQRCHCGYRSLNCRPFKSLDVKMYHLFNRDA